MKLQKLFMCEKLGWCTLIGCNDTQCTVLCVSTKQKHVITREYYERLQEFLISQERPEVEYWDKINEFRKAGCRCKNLIVYKKNPRTMACFCCGIEIPA